MVNKREARKQMRMDMITKMVQDKINNESITPLQVEQEPIIAMLMVTQGLSKKTATEDVQAVIQYLNQ